MKFPAIKEGLRSTLLRIIALDRAGGVTNRIAIKNTCDMLITLGMDSLTVYVNDFESSFLRESAVFYEVCHFHHHFNYMRCFSLITFYLPLLNNKVLQELKPRF